MTVSGPSNSSYVDASVEVALKIHRDADKGHILMFLTGQEEIEKACSMLQTAVDSDPSCTEVYDFLILPLYASLPADEQQKVFMPAHRIRPSYNGFRSSGSKDSSGKSISSYLPSRSGYGYGSTGTAQQANDKKNKKYIRKCVIATNIAETSITVPQVE
jgi:HrpA-like RNA helicase